MIDGKLKWYNEDDKKFIICDGIIKRIEIDENTKEIKNAKSFFREIIYKLYLNKLTCEIELEDSPITVHEVEPIIKDLIKICNDKISNND